MSRVNNWANPSRASAQDVAEMAAALEQRGQALDRLVESRQRLRSPL